MTEHAPAGYRVLARKYRPATFAALIGQDAVVRTLSNAIASGRLAHAFILTGVRGVGKTTTARIIARALNCTGPDGTGGPTPEPCGVCEHCRAIAEDRHVDVLEMDAASRTGVEDIRDIIDGVRYRPVSARYKVYIVDEVHMLSKHAFNALLKTLEEPPEHVKFIFATTEVRRVPVTVLSRCQRFDLRRVDIETLVGHLAAVAAQEKAEVAPEALGLVARAAEGSVRDALSLLDQAISLSEGPVTAAVVTEMLGLTDRTRLFDLYDALMAGEVEPALARLGELYEAGADPVLVMQDLLEITHWLTRLAVVPGAAEGAEVTEVERARGRDLAERLSMPVLTRTWQMLLKGLFEVQTAPSPLRAAEMVLVRIAYAAELPAPAEVVRAAGSGGPQPAAGQGTERAAPAGGGAEAVMAGGRRQQEPQSAGAAAAPATRAPGGGRPSAALAVEPEAQSAAAPARAERPGPRSFEEAVALFAERREPILHAHLVNTVRLVRFEPGRIEINTGRRAPANLANRLGELLSRWTGERWVVSVSREPGRPTLREQAETAEAERKAEAARHPLVRAVLEAFPGATIAAVREREPEEADEDGEASEDFTDGDEER